MKYFTILSRNYLLKVGIFMLFPFASFSQTIMGMVFYDANNNGIKESTEFGFHGAVVKAFAANNTTEVSSYVTDQVTGNYTLSGLTAGTKYRIEFTLPAGFTNSLMGSQSNSTVQFATVGDVNINLGVHVASESNSDTNPRMVAGCGLISGMTTTMASWHYDDANNYPMNYSNTNLYIGTAHPHNEDLTASQVGVPFGLAAKPNTKYIYFTTTAAPDATILPPAPDGIGAIYVADYSGAGNTFSGYKLLMVVPNVAGTSFFGKYGLGGIDFSQDGKDLFVINMGSGKLLKIDVSGVNYASLPATAPTVANITEITIPATYSSCSGGIFRPVALKEYGGKIYLGAICDAFTSQSSTDLKASIISYDYKTLTWKEEFVFEPETFNTGNMVGLNIPQTPWNDPEVLSGLNPFKPVISDLAFDDTGAMIIGVTNRKFYNNNDDNYSTGYVVRAWRNTDGTFTLESGGVSGAYTGLQTGINTIETTYGMDIGGPGNGYFFDQPMAFHPNIYSGGLYVKNGSGELVWGGADPVSINSMGPRYLSLTNGLILKGLNLAGSKISRMTGVEAINVPTPMSLGGRIWKDVNKNSIQDPDELALGNITVQLCDDLGTSIATVNTDANGNYVFSSASGADGVGIKYNVVIEPQTTYRVKVTSIGSNAGISLAGLSNTASEPSDIASLNTGASLANNDAFVNGGFPTIRLKSGAYSESNFTYDIGFGVCTPPISTASATQPNCSGANAPNNGSIMIASFTTERYQYSTGATFNSIAATPTSITSIPAGGIITSTLPNTTGDYTVRIYDATDDACFVDRVVSITAVVCCTNPTADTPVVTQATCNAAGTAANNDASISITGITNATVYAYTTNGSTPAFAGATAVSGGAINLTGLANPAAATTYTFRIFNGSATCYIDVTATLNPKTCTPTCTPPSPTGTGASVCSGNTATLTVTGCDATYPAVWYSNATLTTQVGTGNSFTTPVLSTTTSYYVACVKDASCKSSGATVTATVTPLPTIKGYGKPATCSSGLANNDAKIELYGIANATKYGYSLGTTYSGATYSGATTVTGATATISGLSSGAGNTTYTIRVFNGSDACYDDIQVIIPYSDCNNICTIDGGADILICQPTTTADFVDATATQEWVIGSLNPGGAAINASTGVVSGMSTNGIYSFILREKATPTCMDEVYVFRGVIELPFVSSCEATYQLPTIAGVTWTSVSGGASVTASGLITGMNTDGSYSFSASFGGCTSTIIVEKITCSPTCTAPNAGADVTICLPKTSLNLTDAATGTEWVAVSGNPATAIINATTGVITGMTVTGTYKFRLQKTGDATCSDEMQVIVTAGDAVIMLCNDGSTVYTLIAQSGYTNVVWYNMAGVQVGTGTNLVVSATTVGLEDGSEAYYYEGTNSTDGCAGELCCPVKFMTQSCCPLPNCKTVTVIKNVK